MSRRSSRRASKKPSRFLDEQFLWEDPSIGNVEGGDIASSDEDRKRKRDDFEDEEDAFDNAEYDPKRPRTDGWDSPPEDDDFSSEADEDSDGEGGTVPKPQAPQAPQGPYNPRPTGVPAPGAPSHYSKPYAPPSGYPTSPTGYNQVPSTYSTGAPPASRPHGYTSPPHSSAGYHPGSAGVPPSSGGYTSSNLPSVPLTSSYSTPASASYSSPSSGYTTQAQGSYGTPSPSSGAPGAPASRIPPLYSSGGMTGSYSSYSTPNIDYSRGAPSSYPRTDSYPASRPSYPSGGAYPEYSTGVSTSAPGTHQRVADTTYTSPSTVPYSQPSQSGSSV